MDAHKVLFLEKSASWANSNPDVIALILVGSCAKGTDTSSSDIDLVLITRNPHAYIQSSAWAQEFGSIEREQIEHYGRVTSLRVFYNNGLEVEFGITDESWIAQPLDEGTQQVLRDGSRVLYEKHASISETINSVK